MLIRPSSSETPISFDNNPKEVVLELEDGTAYQGYSFGAEKSVSGELVFQTGMVGYPESITDPSYRGQILVLTFPLVGNYGVPSREKVDPLFPDIPLYFESKEIHVSALVVSSYSRTYSHYLSQSSLGDWLQEKGIPAIYGVDTRALTKKIRNQGSMLGRILKIKQDCALYDFSNNDDSWKDKFESVEWVDPNIRNLVKEVSTTSVHIYKPLPEVSQKLSSGEQLRVLCLDVGIKANQIRCFLNRGVELKVVPWNYDFFLENDYHGLFISNGPGDPSILTTVIERLKKCIDAEMTPIFGICLGHQLLARAIGAETMKMKFGNRGQNIPCTNMINGCCYVTSQNHGYAVDASTLPNNWKELYVNINDGSNEGIYHETLPFFSVQFHPESAPGPNDTEFMFDVFIDVIKRSFSEKRLVSFKIPGKILPDNISGFRSCIKKVLILGSGGLSIGQAGEFDYSGSQAIKALKEEGIYTVLINPNIATVQTSKGLADKVYFLPVNPEFVLKVIKYEIPDAIYVTFGGQTSLNVGIRLKDEFEKLGVKVLGTPISTIIMTEDRELFARSMKEINEKCAISASASNIKDAMKVANDIGYPVIVRAAYALGGLGSGFADNATQLYELCSKAFVVSPQVLIEKSMKGWKEIEYEILRDCRDNCIAICNMENFDPLGIHTGDSVVVAPSQTLSNEDYNMLRTTAINVVRHLGVIGECNIQYALNPFLKEYYIVEVNARLSRSSALASKATGFPLAFIAAKLGLGITLDELKNTVTKKTSTCFEPSLDYIVVKIPRWDLKKFTRVNTQLSSSMKSVGEVMSIGRTFEETIQKAIRAIDYNNLGFNETDALMSLDMELQTPSDQRLFAIANAMYAGYSVERIWELTKIDKWFLDRLMGLINFEKKIREYNQYNIPISLLSLAKRFGYSDRQLAKFLGSTELAIRKKRIDASIIPFVKQIDTVSAEFPAYTNYLYMTYNSSEHDISFGDHGVMVLGSGVYRIGSSVEFDWCAVRAIRTVRERGVKTIMVNYNPETVSTDYDEADRLYFENISLERVLDIYDIENSSGVIISMGGQTPNNIALSLHRRNVKILGTSPEMIDSAENRYKFSRMLDRIGIDQPLWKELTSIDEASDFCESVTYPVLVRPSYVLSGAAMNTVYSKDDLANYLKQAVDVSKEHPVVITKYIEGAKEIELDAVAKDGKLIIHFISEHVENAGVHSGDATLILPPQDLDPETVYRIEQATIQIANALNVTGPFNIQFIAKDNEIKVIECNVRAARSWPFVSKVMGVDLVQIATDVILGFSVDPYPIVDISKNYVGVKVPQFSFSRLYGADPVLGVEMASTGEVASFGKDKYEAYLKALVSTGIQLPKKNILLSIGSFKEKTEMLESVIKLHKLGFKLFATAGTADFIYEHGIPVKYLEALPEDEEHQKSEYSLTQHLSKNLIDMYINLPSNNRFRRPANYTSIGYRTRRMAVDYSIPLITNVKCAKLMIEALSRISSIDISPVDFQTSHKSITLPGFIDIAAFIPQITEIDSSTFENITKQYVTSGFTTICIMPIGLNNSVMDARSIPTVILNLKNSTHCDFTFLVVVVPENLNYLDQISGNITSLFIPSSFLSKNISKLASVISNFNTWPNTKVMITDAKGTDLASILLLTSLYDKPIHISNVTTKDDILLISLSKKKGLKVTCDVSIYSLFLSQSDIHESKALPTEVDQKSLWENMQIIDCFSVGCLPYQVAYELNQAHCFHVGISESLSLLFTAITDKRLTLDDILLRLYYNPKHIFGIPDQADTFIEVEIDRSYVLNLVDGWSPFIGQKMVGSIHRVVFNGQTSYLDGKFFPNYKGKDISMTFNSSSLSLTDVSLISLKKDTDLKPFVSSSRSLNERNSPLIYSEQFKKTSLSFVSQISDAGTLFSLIRNTNFFRKNIISVQQFNRRDMHLLFSIAHEMRIAVERQGILNLLASKVLCMIFFEPSTRTSASFNAAMQRLGGRVISINVSTSSVKKGESLADTIRTLGCYGDAIVLRHPSEDSASIASKFSPVPIINGGNGSYEHPTQAFLDLYTIREELGTVNGLNITFLGDLKYGRTVHSLVRLLRFYQVEINLVSPPQLALPKDIKRSILDQDQIVNEYFALTEEIISTTDVLYCTRVQGERFSDPEEYERLKNSFTINNDVLHKAKPQMIIMHPLPRNKEISEEVDFDQRAAYFREVKYGMFIRMALLVAVLGINERS
ncbi:carbamoyl-phosphate synthase, large subunit [Pneumocystis murina B123]|uniref:Carbamoyl-phosphate synthase, large subunit n=1 Tax=Pneumocystis murina (strain B123) TaxID=1069680 RepID=M7NPC5_PNEMU|nr:carbamoyl-phosphate synthase, large subunit [Pneumocystis murina B123]EMR08946.1 carbamoyl-phosphate synthase, large subunit [Pneumocystis murina B123]